MLGWPDPSDCPPEVLNTIQAVYVCYAYQHFCVDKISSVHREHVEAIHRDGKGNQEKGEMHTMRVSAKAMKTGN